MAARSYVLADDVDLFAANPGSAHLAQSGYCLMRIAPLLARELALAPIALLRSYLHCLSWFELNCGCCDALYASPGPVCSDGGAIVIGHIAITSVITCPLSCTTTRPTGSPFTTGPSIIGGTSYTTCTVATSAFGKPIYVPAESVGPITDDGRIQLTLSGEQVAALGEYLEPATSEIIEADNKSGFGSNLRADVRKVEGKAIHPVERERSFPFLRRLFFWIKRERG